MTILASPFCKAISNKASGNPKTAVPPLQLPLSLHLFRESRGVGGLDHKIPLVAAGILSLLFFFQVSPLTPSGHQKAWLDKPLQHASQSIPLGWQAPAPLEELSMTMPVGRELLCITWVVPHSSLSSLCFSQAAGGHLWLHSVARLRRLKRQRILWLM